ncbi:MAG: MlaD family protein [Bacteroidota bacterium]
MKLNKEVKVGLLAIIALATVYLGINFLKGRVVFSLKNSYRTIYANSKGLNVASPVLLNGVSVGKVTKLQTLPDKGYNVLVTFETDKNIQLTNATEALLISASLFGEKAIELYIEPGDTLKNHDMVPGKIEQGFGGGLLKGTLPALQDIQKISLLANQFITNLIGNMDTINSIFSHLENTTQVLSQTASSSQQDFHLLSQNLIKISSALADNGSGVQPFLENLNRLMQGTQGKEVPALIAKLNHILSSAVKVLNKMEQENSSFGLLLEDDNLYHNLNEALGNLNAILVDLKRHPWRYINISLFGRKRVQERIPPQ